MTTYVMSTLGGASGGRIIFTPSPSYETRITQVVFQGSSSGTGATISGGTAGNISLNPSGYSGGQTITSTPLRTGALASSASGLLDRPDLGGPYILTGPTNTGTLVFSSAGGAGWTSSYQDASGLLHASGGGLLAVQPTFDLIVSPGSSLYAIGGGGEYALIMIYFEELRLSWPY